MAELGLFEAIYTARALRRLKPDPVPDELSQGGVAGSRENFDTVPAPLRSNTHKTSVILSLRFLYDEMLETVAATMSSMCPAVPGDLVRSDFDMTDGLTSPL